MTHFAEARDKVLTFFQTDAAIRGQLERVCLIWDLQGRLRLLLRPLAGQDANTLRAHVQGNLGTLSPFWSGEIWLWTTERAGPEQAVYETAWKEAEVHVADAGPPEIRILDRQVSKSAWFAPRHTPPWPLNAHTPAILSFYSFKGGVGRTTALLSLAIQLSRAGKRVMILDLDLEAPGIMAALPPADPLEPPCGLADYLLERPLTSTGDALTLADYHYSFDAPDVIGDGPPVTIVPAGRLDRHYLHKLARLDYERLAALPENGENPSPLMDLLRRLRAERNPEYVLLDSRAGFHDLGGLALSGISHLDVVLGLETEQSWRGMEIVIRFLGRDRVERSLPQLHCALVHAMAPDPGSGRDEAAERFREHAYQLFTDEYYDPEGSEGEWPVPDPEAEEQPHFPTVLGFNPQLRYYQTVKDVAEHLIAADFRRLRERILDRIGRRLE